VGRIIEKNDEEKKAIGKNNLTDAGPPTPASTFRELLSENKTHRKKQLDRQQKSR
jgi:hypothetical protein